MGIKVEIGGVLGRIGQRLDKIEQGSRQAVLRTAEEIMADSKENYVPIDTGNLKSTGTVQVTADRPQLFEATLSYGGPSAAYAIFVHENLQAKHAIGQALYLTTPARKVAPNIPQRIKNGLPG